MVMLTMTLVISATNSRSYMVCGSHWHGCEAQHGVLRGACSGIGNGIGSNCNMGGRMVTLTLALALSATNIRGHMVLTLALALSVAWGSAWC